MSSRPRIVPDPPDGGADGCPDGADFSAGLWRAVDEAPALPAAATRVAELLRVRTGSDAVGLSIRGERGGLERLAACGSLLDEPVDARVDVAHDPLASPLADGGVLAIDDTAEDATWPDWSVDAASRGIRSARFVGLASLHDRPVVLGLYAGRPHAFAGERAAVVVDAACQAGHALRQVERLADLERDGDERALVGQAAGLLMERYHLAADQALGYLVRSAERAHLDLQDLARELVAAQNRAAAHTRTPLPERPQGPGRTEEVAGGG